MTKMRFLFLSVTVLSLSACAQFTPQSNLPTRLETNPLGIHSSPVLSDGLTEQTAALNASARGIVRSSTLKGAIIGAAVGCGIGVLAADASACAKTAALGAAGGAVAGYVAGNQDVARRVELASPNGLVRNLRKANNNLASIKQSLPVLLSQQDAELTELSLALANGDISKANHDTRVENIRSERAALAEALTLTADQARLAVRNLKTASANGHKGLDWHIAATDQLARETVSARSTISLL